MNREGAPPPPTRNSSRPRSRKPGRAAPASIGVTGAAAEHVPMAVREGDEVAGGKLDALAVLQLDVGPAFAEQVVDDHVPGPSREQRARACATRATRDTTARRTPR